MSRIHIRHHWLGRLIASDPGSKRLQQAGKATLSLISSVAAMIFLMRLIGDNLLTPVIVSGMAGLMGIITVMDETEKEKKGTTLLLGVSAIIGVTLAAVFINHAYTIDVFMLLAIFNAFYLTRFSVRYFSLCMIFFMIINISFVIKVTPNQLPLFYLGAMIGIINAYLVNFHVFKDSAQVLKRGIRSFHIQSNLTFSILIKIIEDPETKIKRQKSLEKNVRKLNEYARSVAADLNAHDVEKIWPGLQTSMLRLYVFDAEMLIETLADSIRKLKKADALEFEELRRLLVWVVKSLRDTEVLAQNYESEHLVEAEKAVQALRFLLGDLLNREDKPQGWLYLIRRIESITNHVIEGAATIQQSLQYPGKKEEDLLIKTKMNDKDETGTLTEKGLKQTTKKAYQALVGGTAAIIVGQMISPAQPYWVLLTTFIVLLGTESVGRTYIKGFKRSFGTIIGAIIGFALAKTISNQTVLEVILLFVIIFLAFYVLTVSYTMMSIFITMLIAIMYGILLGGISLQLMGARVIDTIAGAAIAFGVSFFIFPKRTKDKVADSLEEFLIELHPYVTDYVRSFREDVNVKGLVDQAFEIDQKMQAIKDEAQTLLKRPGFLNNSGIARWITIFTAINYYAKHLVASSYQKNFDYPKELVQTFKSMEEKLGKNIDTLQGLIKGKEQNRVIYNLDKEREQIERLAPSRNQSHLDLIHHLYYVWRINQSLVALGAELEAKVE
ncbi:FUSC family protein [Bacillus sp. IB182487]|uniref:FUSC family protein n=2 Tax=Metabacillus arenae TaxID=2771434 RepID=A0A926NK75_9BACI|nr:FUSC family protein [Metabacillus arenae]